VCCNCGNKTCVCYKYNFSTNPNRTPISYRFVILDMYSKIIFEKAYTGIDVIDNLIENLINEEQIWIKSLLSSLTGIRLLKNEEKQFEKMFTCYVCGDNLSHSTLKFEERCHYSGKHIGIICENCNKKNKDTKKLQIFMNKTSDDEFDIIFKAILKKVNVKNIKFENENNKSQNLSFNSFTFVDINPLIICPISRLCKQFLEEEEQTYTIINQSDIEDKMKNIRELNVSTIMGKTVIPFKHW